MGYAQHTSVPVERSRGEIEATLHRYGASMFASMSSIKSATICFEVGQRRIRITLDKSTPAEFKLTPQGRTRNSADCIALAEQEDRRRWRALLLVIKAKLEAVESKIATFEDEFLPYTVMPNGETVAEHINPQLHEMFLNKKMPKLLGMG